jgi:hypothetical protein
MILPRFLLMIVRFWILRRWPPFQHLRSTIHDLTTFSEMDDATQEGDLSGSERAGEDEKGEGFHEHRRS